MKTVVIIGSGNVGSNLGKILLKKGYIIKQVYSKTLKNAESLAVELSASFTNDPVNIFEDADIYIFSIRDQALSSLIEFLPSNTALWIHTAGSVSIDVFKGKIQNYGVLYPLQTFSKGREPEWPKIPFLIEGSSIETESEIKRIALQLSESVYPVSSKKRQYIHLSAVFVCNFVNYMYTIGNDFMSQTDIPFSVLLPLIDETAKKVHSLCPRDAQTGPAIRFDKNIIEKQLGLIENEQTKELYYLISQEIHNRYKYL